MKRIIMAAMIVSLAACGGDKDDVATEQQQEWESQKQSLVYSFPDNNQQEVPVPSPVVLRFSSPVMETSPAVVLREVGGPVVSDFEMEWVDGKRGLIITPDSKLKPMTDYVVQVPAIELENGVAPAKNIRFSTRALFEGPKSLVASDTFEVTRMIPDGENYQVMDFSSFRVQFSQPLDQTTVKYGDSADATVQLMGPEGVVDAHLLVSGHYMTVDPKEDLTPGAEYSLNMTTGITSTYGETLPGGSFGNPGDTLAVSVKVSPQDTKAPGTGLRVSMVQDVADTGELSPLTGQPINLVPMASVLLGEDTATQASGTVAAELAFVPNFPEATPFRVKRGSLIEGASIEVLIGGEVPAGFESGKVRMDFLSDATGYLLPNPYSDADDAPRQVRLFMDVAVSTETAEANGAITQDLMHIELVGTSIVEEGQMVINAVGVVEPNVLGSERATGILSFYMKAIEDQDHPPQINIDTTPPSLQSWIPNENIGFLQRNDLIVFNFDEPILIKESNIEIYENGGKKNFIKTVSGTSLKIDVLGGLSYGSNYEILINGRITDLYGNVYSGEHHFHFETENLVTKRTGYFLNLMTGQPDLSTEIELPAEVRSPIILASYPGFPCVIDEQTLDLGNKVGRCKGSFKGWFLGLESDIKEADDYMPIQRLPANRPIIVNFSKDMNKESFIGGAAFSVYEIDQYGGIISEIEGSLEINGNSLRFWPEKMWSEDAFYKYMIKSNGDRLSANAACDEIACDSYGYPLQTQLLSIEVVPFQQALPSESPERLYRYTQSPSSPAGGGPDFVQYFIGGRETENVLQSLRASGGFDSNANFIHERNYSVADGGPSGGILATVKNALSFRYEEYEERGADTQPIDDRSDPLLDIGGVLPPPNSAKVLSKRSIGETGAPGTLPAINAINIGCGYEYYDYAEGRLIPYSCPRQIFSYMNSSLVTEITSEYLPDKGIKVLIWPGQIMATSVETRIAGGSDPIVLRTSSGAQLLRMRYAKDDEQCMEGVNTTCPRSSPIVGYIKEENGIPTLTAQVDIYMDGLELENNLSTIFANPGHGLISYPFSIELKGVVDFLPDGRMLIEQYNINDIDIDFGVYTNRGSLMGIIPLRIPKYGNRLQYISEIIRK